MIISIKANYTGVTVNCFGFHSEQIQKSLNIEIKCFLGQMFQKRKTDNIQSLHLLGDKFFKWY